jgi:hypothetical protein
MPVLTVSDEVAEQLQQLVARENRSTEEILRSMIAQYQGLPQNYLEKIAAVVRYINEHDFILKEPELYDHMGAILVDAFLQAGVNYTNVVLPRVQRIKAAPEASTTTGLIKKLQTVGPEKLLGFSGKKPMWVLNAAQFFEDEGVQTAGELKRWLENKSNRPKLNKLKGCGPKTQEYLQLLVGLEIAALDTQLRLFLLTAGIRIDDDSESREILRQVADKMGIKQSTLEFSIWKHAANQEWQD